MDITRLKQFVDPFWDNSILPSITEYIRIPNKSPHFDPQWVEHGYMEDAVTLMVAWATPQLAGFPGATLEVVRLPGRTPLIFIEVPGDSDDTVLLYGHLDKQPEMKGWAEGTGPWIPVLKGDKLYGRGGADDGYAIYACLCALRALAEQKVPRGRCVIMIEACEESGSYDLPFYVDHLMDADRQAVAGGLPRFGLRRLGPAVAHDIAARHCRRDAHRAGADRGRPFGRRLGHRALLLPHHARASVAPRGRGHRRDQAARPLCPDPAAAHRAGQGRRRKCWASRSTPSSRSPEATRPMADDLGQMVLNRTWRPQLAVIGMDGYPAPGDAGNVLLPYSTAQLSLRTPPTLDAAAAVRALKQTLEADPPHGAEVTFEGWEGQSGWHAPPLAPWLEKAVAEASQEAFGQPAAYMGEGGSIPFMGMLGEKFPATQFVITGVLGPHSNAHGPNEFLHIPTGKRVTMATARLIAAHYGRANAKLLLPTLAGRGCASRGATASSVP